jgi:hypothetical protein
MPFNPVEPFTGRELEAQFMDWLRFSHGVELPLGSFRNWMASIRLDELERIQSATLDAQTDVWSTDDDGQIIPLTERVEQVQKHTFQRPGRYRCVSE